MGVGHEQLVDEILVLDAGGGLAAAAAALCLIVRDRLRLGIAAMRQRDNHVLGGNQIFGGQVLVIDEDLGTALVAERIADELQLHAYHLEQPLGTGQNIRQVAYLLEQLLELGNDLVLLQSREPIEAHLQDGLRLDFRQAIASLDDA